MSFSTVAVPGLSCLARVEQSGLTPEPDDEGAVENEIEAFNAEQAAAPPFGETTGESEPIGQEDDKKDEEEAVAPSPPPKRPRQDGGPPPKRRKILRLKIVVREDDDDDDDDEMMGGVPAAPPSPPKGKENEGRTRRKAAIKSEAKNKAYGRY